MTSSLTYCEQKTQKSSLNMPVKVKTLEVTHLLKKLLLFSVFYSHLSCL